MKQTAYFTNQKSAWEFAKMMGAREDTTITDFGKTELYFIEFEEEDTHGNVQ